MRTIAIIVSLFIGFSLSAQQVSFTPTAGSEDNRRVTKALLKHTESVGRMSPANIKRVLEIKQIAHRDSDGNINVELIDMQHNGRLAEVAEILNLEVKGIWKNRADCYVSAEQLQIIADNVPEGYYIKAVYLEPVNDQGAALQNSQTYIDAGKDGTGIKIGVIDSGFENLDSLLLSGDVTSDFDSLDLTGNGMMSGSPHGTGCFEVACDNAPGAQYFLYRSGNGTQFGLAVADCISNNVDVITCSLGPHNTGWDDNSGAYNDAVKDAVDAGMLFFVTAGNEAKKHWQGDLNDNDDDNWHQWQGTDELNSVNVPDSSSSSNTVQFWLQWDSDATTDHYDMYLFDDSDNSLLDIANETSEFEFLNWTNDSAYARDVSIAILAKTENPPEFEIFCNRDFEFRVATSSIECPSNNTYSNCISVGAVHRNDYNSLAGTTPITDYSSHGPTNGGNQAPDICAVTSSTSQAYGGGDFSGTSCSAPNAAGAAAALWSALPGYSADGIRQLLFRKAYLFKDWGTPGLDMIYGHGGLYLKDYTVNTLYIYRNSGNNNGTATLPYNSIQQADQYAPSNRNIFYLGGNYDIPGGGIIADKPMIYRSLVQASTVD